jgi:hypothetical protein
LTLAPKRRLRDLIALGLLLPVVACGGDVVTLGRVAADASGAQGPQFAEPKLVLELASDGDQSDNPTLTADLLEIFFTSEREGGAGEADVWTARRDFADQPFAAPEPVAVVNTDQFETSPAVSPDGLELWLGSERDGGVGEQDIWVARRSSRNEAWTEPQNVSELNSPEKDIPRPTAQSGNVMPLGSRRGGLEYYQTFLAERASKSEPFGEPRQLSELELAGQSAIDAFLTEDGLTLYFNRSPGAGESAGDLFVATRPSLSAPFSAELPLTTINTSQDERDPWLSPAGDRLFFSSDRDGTLSIYEASLLEP